MDIHDAVEKGRIGVAHIYLLIVAMLVAIAEGYDLSAAGLIGPSLIKEFGITKAALGPYFTAGFIGMAIGAVSFAWVGDRFGRKRAVIWSTLAFGIFTTISGTADNLTELAVLRFLTGLGLGGVLPNLLALVAEYFPQKSRSFFVGLVITGAPTGTIIASAFSGWLMHEYGWRSLLYTGGALPVIVTVLVVFALPESIQYLALLGNRKEQLNALMARFYKLVNIDFVYSERTNKQTIKTSPKELFTPTYRVATITLWIMTFVSYIVIYYQASWMPVILSDAGMTPGQRGFIMSMWTAGGIIGSISVTALMGRFGGALVAVLMLMSTISFTCLGLSYGNITMMTFWCVMVGLSVFGTQSGLMALISMVYGTPVRAIGSGIAASIGRVGGMFGPLLGSTLLMVVASEFLLFAPPVVLIIGAGAAATFAGKLRRKTGSFRVRELGE
jgi:AAHS family 4-hydroxybenzoate transporter-like MFS transporter